MLIGPKGSGKTHVGTLANRRTDIADAEIIRAIQSINR
jgi:hypothetical protein